MTNLPQVARTVADDKTQQQMAKPQIENLLRSKLGLDIATLRRNTEKIIGATAGQAKFAGTLFELFEGLAAEAARQYFQEVGIPASYQEQGSPPFDTELEAWAKSFAEFAHENRAIGREFFFALEKGEEEDEGVPPETTRFAPIDSRSAAELDLAARELAERFKTAGANTEAVPAPPKTEPETAAIPEGEAGSRTAPPEPEPDEAENIVAAILPELQNLILGAHAQHGWPGVASLRAAILRQTKNIPQAATRINKAIEEILAANGIEPEEKDDLRISGLPRELAGSYEEVALKAMAWLKKHPADGEATAALCTGPLAKAVRRLEENGISKEKQVDLMIHAFAGENVYHRSGNPPCNQAFREFLARLRAMLAVEGSDPDAGFLETQVNLTTWYGQTREAACQGDGIDLALSMLPQILRRGDDKKPKDPVRIAKMLHQLANNVAGWLSRLLGFQGDEESLDQQAQRAQSLNAMHALATVAFLRSAPGSDWQDAAPLYAALGAGKDSPQRGELAPAFLFMANVPSAWRQLSPALFPVPAAALKDIPARVRTSVLALFSALTRALFNPARDGDEIPQALFNLGVDINIHGRSTADSQGYVPLRLLANGLGLWWALTQARSDEEAIEGFNGGDCAVNFFGALNEKSMAALAEKEAERLSAIGRAVLGQFGEGTDGIRLGNSYERLFGEAPKAAGRFDRPALAKSLAQALQAFLAAWKLPDLPASDGDYLARELARDKASFARTAATLLKWAYTHAGKETAAHYQACVDTWLGIADTLVGLSKKDGYADFEGKIPSSLEAWGVKEKPARYSGPVDPNLLSRTLADEKLMRGVFGVTR